MQLGYATCTTSLQSTLHAFSECAVFESTAPAFSQKECGALPCRIRVQAKLIIMNFPIRDGNVLWLFTNTCSAQRRGSFFSRECSSQCVAQALSLGMRNVKRAQKEERAPTRWRGSANNKGLIRRLKQRNELQAARRADEDAAHLPREMSWSSV
jgi:hypothetical protein